MIQKDNHTEGSTGELEVSAIAHPSFNRFVKLNEQPEGVKLPYKSHSQTNYPPCPAIVDKNR